MKSNLLLFVLLLLSQIPKSFSSELDSLLLICEKGQANAIVYNKLAEGYYEVNIDSGILFAQLALDYAVHADDDAQIGEAYYQIADGYYYSDQIDSTVIYYLKSLEYYLKTNLNNEIAGVYNDIGQMLLLKKENDSSQIYFDFALEYIDRDELPEGYYSIMINKANAIYNAGNYSEATSIFEMILKEGSPYLSEERKAILYGNLGLSYKKTANFDKAIYYYQKGLKLAQSLDDQYSIAIDLSNIAAVYISWKKYNEALDYFQQSYRLYEKYGYSRDITSCLSNIASSYRFLNKNDDAERFYQMALDTALEINHTYYIATAIHGLAQVSYTKGDYEECVTSEIKALKYFKKTGSSYSMTNVLLSLSRSYLALNSFDNTKLHLEKAEILIDRIQSLELKMELASQWAQYYLAIGNHQKSIAYYQKFILINDSIFDQKNHRLVTEFQIKLETLKKQKELETLLLTNELSRQKIEQKNLFIILLTGGLFISLLAGGIVYYFYRQKQKSYQVLFDKNKEFLSTEKQTSSCKKSMIQSGISDELIKKLIEDLYQKMEKEKVFKQQDLSIHKLAGYLNTNTSYLSKIINEHFHQNFSAYLSKYRIIDAQELMHQKKYSQYTIEAIANECGFKSKSSFNEAFKKSTGLTPGYYLQKIKYS